MPGINSSGAPNTRDYVLGRGRIYFGKLTAAGLLDSDGLRDLGNAPEFTVSMTVEDITHQSSRSGLKITDARCTISQEVGLAFQLDELNFQNLADFFAGTTSVYDNPHDTTWTGHETAIVSAAIKIGRWYELRTPGGARVYNLDAGSLVYSFEEDPAGTPATLAANDYEIDEQLGLVRFLSTGTTTLADGDTVGWAITTAAAAAQDVDQVNALQVAQVSGVLVFVQENACDGDHKTEFRFHKVSLSADGDLSAISDEFGTLNFTGVAEVNSGVTDTSKVLTIRTYDQA
jgi:hypothetical protein